MICELRACNTNSERLVDEYRLRIDDLEKEKELLRDENSHLRQLQAELKRTGRNKELELRGISEELELEKEKNAQLEVMRRQSFEKQRQSETKRFKLEEELAKTQLELQEVLFKVSPVSSRMH